VTREGDARAAAWAVRLLDARVDEATWARYGALDDGLRAAVVTALKARVDALVRNEPPAALPVAEALVRAASGLGALLPLALRGRAAAAHFNGDHEAAARDFERAAALYDADGHEVQAAAARRSLVDVYHMGGRSAEALACADRARPVLEARGETRLLAQLRLNVGNVHARLDDYPTAGRHYAGARALFVGLHDPVGVAFADFNLAVVEMNANRVDAAERRWLDARAGMDAAGMGMLVADCDYNLAYLQSRRGRFGPAIEGLLRARRAYEGNHKPSGIPLCDLDLAEIHLRLDARRDALEHASRARDRFAELGMEYELARAEVLLGITRARLGERDGALASLSRAGERFARLGNRSFASFADIQRAGLQIEHGDARAAVRALLPAEATLRRRGMPWLADLARLVLVRATLALPEPARALELLRGRRPPREDGAEPDGLLEAIAQRLEAQAREALGDRDGALAVLEGAVAGIESAYAHVPAGDVRVAFFRDQHPAFVDLAFALIEARRPRDALLALEQGRSRSLRERHAAPDVDDARFVQAREQLDWLLSRQLDAQLGFAAGSHDLRGAADEGGAGGTAPTSRIAAQIKEVRAELARLATRRGPAGALPGLTLDALAGARRGDELLLVYLTGPKGASVLVHDGGGPDGLDVRAVRLPTDAPRLAALRDRLLFQVGRLQLGGAYRARNERSILASLDALFDELGACLIEPVRAMLPDAFDAGRPLTVVPYGALHDLPFHAFRSGGAPLVERHELAYGLSAWQLARARAARAACSPRNAVPSTDPDVVWVTGAGLDRLPAVARETAAVRAFYGASCRSLEPGALAALLREGGIRGRILHVAGHGRFEAAHPRFSAVCLGATFLLAHDIASTTLDIDLVTLSGCETGRKLRVGGDELLGLSRALLGAGARSVLASHWPVDDQDAADFMQRVYADLAAGTTARTAVRGAQRALARGARHPLSWAAFSLLGDPEVVAPAGAASPARRPA
jgi:tetratricopeptide (TPR) repeat protein